MMKKLLALLLAGVLALSMSACCCCLPMEDFELPDFDIPDFELPNVQRPSAENSKPTGDVIIVVPSDPDKENSDPGNDPSGEIQQPTEPERPSEMPTIKPQPSVPSRKEVSRCVYSSAQQTDFGTVVHRVALNGNMISQTTYIHPAYEDETRSVFYDWDARRGYIVADGGDGEIVDLFTWDEQGNIIQSDTSDKSIRYSYTTFNEVETIHVYDKSGTLLTQVVMEYDSENRPVSSITYGQYGQEQGRMEQSFNEYGDLLRYTSLWGGYLECDDVYTYEYDDNGNMVSMSCTSAIDGSFVSSEIYTYNNNGLLEYTYFLSEDGSCHRWNEYQYNDAGLQTRQNAYDNEGLCNYTITEYDFFGNVTYIADYLCYGGESRLEGEYRYQYQLVYLTEAEERVQAYVDNLAGGQW